MYYRIADESVLIMCEQLCGAIERDIGSLAAAVRGERAGQGT